jgi:HK97 family phage portal protein
MNFSTIFNKLLHPVSVEEQKDNYNLGKKFSGFLPYNQGKNNEIEPHLNKITAQKLKRMSNTDPIVWSIKKTRKDQVTQQKWDIVADLDREFADLDRWETIAKTNLNPYGFTEEFKPTVLSREIIARTESDLKRVQKGAENIFEKQARIKFLFEMVKRQLKQEAEIHRLTVKDFLSHPNDTQTSFESFLKLLVDDILTFDAGVIIKNLNNAGSSLAELYTLPGHEVKLVKNTDGSTPKPPSAAYLWTPTGIDTEPVPFTNDELVYIVDNPQHSGYGMSPLEVAIFIIVASLYAENYNLDFLKHSNIPPGILSLGAGVDEDTRKTFQTMWDAEINMKGGLHRILFAAGSDNMKLIPLKNLTNKDMQLMEYLKWTLSIKCMAYQISPQDIGFTQDFHRTTSEVQKEISKTRGLKNLLSLSSSYINQEVVKAAWPFKDVKFKWLDVDLEDAKEQSEIDNTDLRNGVISINERREAIGAKPIDGGDEHFVYSGSGKSTTSIEEDYKIRQQNAQDDMDDSNDPNNTGPNGNANNANNNNNTNNQNTNNNNNNNHNNQNTNNQNTNNNTNNNGKTKKMEKIGKYSLHDDSLMVNAGTFVKSLEYFENNIRELLKEE